MAHTHYTGSNGERVELTADEIAECDARDAVWAEEQIIFVATQYSRDRKAKYDLLNQDEMRFDDQVNGTTTWVDAINAIKAAHPKP